MSFNKIIDQGKKRRRNAYVANLQKARERPCVLGERIEDHDCDFDALVERARTKPCLTTNQDAFLSDIEGKYAEYGDQMFFSEAQHEYLEYLASKGVPDDDEEDDE